MPVSVSVRIAGVGICCQDHLLTVPRFAWGTTARVRDYRVQGGGQTATALVAAARLGATTELISLLGDDAEGDAILEELRGWGVGTEQVLRVRGGRSPRSTVLVDAETGERTILHQDARFPSGSDLPNPRIDADVLLVDAYHTDLALAGARAARARGIPVVSDVLPRGERAKLLAETDVAIAPEELLELAGTPGDALAACAYLRGLGPRTAVVTLGERGYVWQDPQGCGQGDAFPLEVVVDTTGAGDVFHGAFAFALVQGRSTAACCRFAAAASALNCAAAGGRGGIPTLAEVTSLVSERGW